MFSLLLDRLLSLLATPAFAQETDPCTGVPGGCAPVNVLLNVVPAIGPILVGLAAGASALFVVYGGALMLMSFGDDSRGQKGKTAIIYALVGFGVALASQTIVTFVHSRAMPLAGSDLPVLDLMGVMVGALVSLFNVAFIAVILYAGFRLVLAWGKTDEYGKAWTMILWAIGGMVIVNVARALVYAVYNLFL